MKSKLGHKLDEKVSDFIKRLEHHEDLLFDLLVIVAWWLFPLLAFKKINSSRGKFIATSVLLAMIGGFVLPFLYGLELNVGLLVVVYLFSGLIAIFQVQLIPLSFNYRTPYTVLYIRFVALVFSGGSMGFVLGGACKLLIGL